MGGSDEARVGCLSRLPFLRRKRPKSQRDPSKPLKTTNALTALTPNPEKLSASAPATDKRPVETQASRPDVLLERPPAGIKTSSESVGPAAGQQPAAVSASTTPLSLWQEAHAQVDQTTLEWIQRLPGVTDTTTNLFPDLVNLVRSQEKEHIEAAPKLKIGEREILWRDYAERVVDTITMIGDIAINFAPAPSPAIWSGVKVLLRTNVSECKDLAAIMGCTDMVLHLVKRGMVYEEVYITESPRPAMQEDLRQTTITVYKSCLEFLAFVDNELQSGHGHRFLQALVDPGHGEARVSTMRALERDLDSAAHTCEVKAGDQHRKLLQRLEAPVRRVDENVLHVLQKLKKDEKEKAMNYISDIPVGRDHAGKREKRTKGTCEWLTSHPRFLDWENAACSSVLWLQGNMGTGKTYLSSKVIDRFLVHDDCGAPSEHDEGFAFFYCSSSDQSRQGIDNILRSYVRQLSEVPGRPESTHRASYALYQNKDKIQRAIDVATCETTLQEIINNYPRTTLVLDALDECDKDTRMNFIQLIERLVSKSSRVLRVFIASRSEIDIQRHMEPFRIQQSLISVSVSDNSGDIEKFVTDEMEKRSRNWSEIALSTKELVRKTLVEKSQGMFRWTYLQWEQLKELEIEEDIETRLSRLPKTLSGAYDEIMSKYDTQGSELAILHRAIRWVMYAREALDSSTLLTAIRVESAKVDGKTYELTEQKLESVCRHLVVRDVELGVWKFPHASVLEYFQDRNEKWLSAARGELTVLMINCLKDCCSESPSKWPPPAVIPSEMEAWFDYTAADPNNALDPRHPFQKYVQQNWIQYIQDFTSEEAKLAGVDRALQEFLGEPGPQKSSPEYRVFATIILSGRWNTFYDQKIDVKPVDNNVFGIVVLGLHEILSGWWDNDVDNLSIVNGEDLDLLQLASIYGYIDLCRNLVSRGCDPNREGEGGLSSALYESIRGDRIEVARLLLARGTDPNASINGHSYLCTAAERGSEYLELLLKSGADPNLKCDDRCYYGGSALSKAAGYGNIDVARILLNCIKAIDPRPETLRREFGSPLAMAARRGQLDGARLLVENGADVNAKVKFQDYGSPLAAAASRGELECVRFLVTCGARTDLYLQYGDYSNAFAAAVLGTYHTVDTVEFLIEEHKADPRALSSFTRPRLKKPQKCYCLWKHDEIMRAPRHCEVAAYLIQEQNIEAELLISIGFPPEAIPSDGICKLFDIYSNTSSESDNS